MPIGQNTNVILEGRGSLDLRPKDHIATGGEGSVYRANNTVIKLFTDPYRKMVLENKKERIERLKTLSHPFIVAPKGFVFDPSAMPIGYYMDFAKGEAMPKVFTNQFRNREGFGDQDAIDLTHNMREAVAFAHTNRALIIDGNELNQLVDLSKAKPEPRLIDVDSWVVDKKFPSSLAVMPSIRDFHTKGWNELSDWFGWGVVSFQVFTGIHPYKGKLAGYRPVDMERRMKDNASVFTPEALSALPKSVRDFSCIPGRLLDWYMATFQNGERSIPPSPYETGTAVTNLTRAARVVTTASGALVYDKTYSEAGDPVVRLFHCGVVLLASGKLVDLNSKRTLGKVQSAKCEVVRTAKGWLVADFDGTQNLFCYVSATSFQETHLSLTLALKKFVSYENRLFAVTEKGLTELLIKDFGKPILAPGKTWGIRVNATQWFDGVGVQDAMGAMFLVTPFGEAACKQTRIPELDGLKVVTAKAGFRFVTCIAMDKKGDYVKLEITFDKTYKTYAAWVGGTSNPDLNIAILPKQVCATIVDDGELNIFVPSSNVLNKLKDRHLSTDMVLYNWENTVMYIQNGELWKVKMT